MRLPLRPPTYLAALIVSVLSPVAFASTSGVTYQGRILKPDGSPLAGQFTQFKMQIRTPDSGSCLMYEEVQSQDLRNSGGVFSLTINDGTGSRTDSTGLTLDRIFANRGAFTLNPGSCNAGPGTYAPGPNDGRDLVVLFKDETMVTWEPIPAQKINFVPFAFEAKQIAGFTADSLLRVVNGSGDPLTGLAPLSNAQYTALMDLVNGSSAAYTHAGQLNGVALPTMNSGEVLGWNGSAWVSQTAVGGANSVSTTMIQNGAVDGTKLDPAISISTSGTIASAITTTRDFKIYAASPSTFYVGMLADPALAASYTLTWPLTKGTNGQVLTSDGAGKLTWTSPSSAGITDLTGDVTATGPGSAAATVVSVGGSAAADVHSAELLANAATSANTPNTIVKRDGSGNFSAGAVTASSVQADTLKLNNAGSVVNVVNPMGSAYTLTLPSGTGTSGQVLTTDGSGLTSWTTALTGSIGFVQGGNTFGVNADLGTNDAHDLNLRTNGTTKVTVTSSGNVGIGTTSPSYVLSVKRDQAAATKIAVENLSSSPSAYTNFSAISNAGSVGFGINSSANSSGSAFIWNSANSDLTFATNDSEKMRISAAGNVGIGTTSPTLLLDVAGRMRASNMSGAYSPAMYLENPFTLTAGYGPNLTFRGGVSINMGSVGAQYEGASNNSSLVLSSAASSTLKEGMRLTSAGNVGIGTTSPLKTLSVVGSGIIAQGTSGAVLHALKIENTSSSAADRGVDIAFGTGSSDAGSIAAANDDGTGTSAYMSFGTRTSGSVTEKMRISSAGNVGIGTTSPGYKLDVAGIANATQLCIAGDCKSAWPSGGSGDFMKNGSVAMTGNLKLVNGLTTAPALTFASDNTTGLSYDGSRLYISVLTGVVGFDSFGNVIADSGAVYTNAIKFNASDTSYIGKAATNEIAIATSSAERVRIDASGRVGIGTTSPGYKLDVAGDVNVTGNFKVNGTNIATGGGDFKADGSVPMTGSLTMNAGAINVMSGGTAASPALNIAGNGGIFSPAASTIAFNNGATEAMRVSAGKVGIGTTSPTQLLDVNGNVKSGGLMVAAANVTNPSLRFTSDATSGVYSPTAFNLGLVTNSTERIRIDGSGNVGIGTTSPTQTLEVNGTVLASAYLYSSDRRLKKDITPLEQSLDKLLTLNTVKFNWIEPKNKDEERMQIGLIAQDVQKVFPEAVKEDSQGWLRMNYQALISPIIDGMREMYHKLMNVDAKTEALQARVSDLEAKNKALEERLSRLEQSLERQPASAAKPTKR